MNKTSEHKILRMVAGVSFDFGEWLSIELEKRDMSQTEFARKMGGDLVIESEVAKGTTVTMSLPLLSR